MRRVVFVDMDGVLADFDGAIKSTTKEDPPEMFVPGFFRELAVMKGAKEGVAALLANPKLDVYIGSKVTSKNPLCCTEKMEWIKEHFPGLLRRIVLCCDKSLLRGDVLIDDDVKRWSHKFQGHFIHFDKWHPEKSWKMVIEELCK